MKLTTETRECLDGVVRTTHYLSLDSISHAMSMERLMELNHMCLEALIETALKPPLPLIDDTVEHKLQKEKEYVEDKYTK